MMNKKIALGLKIFSIIVAVIGAFFFFLYVPIIIKQLASESTEAAWLKWPGTICIWILAILCYLALWNFWHICTRIGRDESFCAENVRSMKNISVLALIATCFIICGGIFLYFIGYLNAAGFFILFFVAFIGLGIAVLAYALTKLISNAAELKNQVDLTI